MRKNIIHSSQQLYGMLLQLYPKSYRREFGKEMQYVFSEQLNDSYREHGESGIIHLWFKTIIDSLKSCITQHLEAQKGDTSMSNKNTDITLKVVGQTALMTLGLLLIPLLGTIFGGGFNWDESDFIVAGILVFVIGIGLQIARLKIRDRSQALIAGIVLAVIGLWLYVELAVGLFTNWGS